MTLSKYEYSMELLAAMACKTIAEQKKIPQIKAFDSFIKSKTANMLFDERTAFGATARTILRMSIKGRWKAA